jgi:Domain of unknown function (DUF6487)
MSETIPSVTDFAGEPGTRACPKCGAIMDHGNLQTQHNVYYVASQSQGWTNTTDVDAFACIACGYIELTTDPEALRCMLAGVKPPKEDKKPGLL